MDEFAGEPVEEFGVRGRRAGMAEVAERFYQAGAEVMFPDAVHHDARGQWVVWSSEPSGEGESPTG